MHFRFDEETEETAEQELARRLRQPAATQSSGSYGACTNLHAVNVLKTDFDSGDQCYVFDVAASMTVGIVAAALSNHTVKLYNARDSGGFTYLGELKGHTDVISEIAFAGDDNPHALYSSSEEGSVRGWDSRTGQQAESFAAGTGKLFSFSLMRNYLAAGSDGEVFFWDRRTGKQCGAFTDTHAEDVTQVKFCHNRLISGSVDGLINVFDISTGFDEDEGFLAAFNIENSVSRLGLYGLHSEKLWCLSHTETLHLWEWVAACDEESAGGQGVLGEDRNARASLTQAASMTPGADALGPGLDYLISCAYSPRTSELLLLAGNNQGAVGCFPVAEPSAPGGTCTFAGAKALLAGGHSSVVRSLLWSDSGALLSGGEDARLVQWSVQPAAGGEETQTIHKPSQRVSNTVTRKDQAVRRRQSPY
ncbi:hypothetical protein ABBQ38_001524 [Trebouxia sp. C0009 RCD-2024]